MEEEKKDLEAYLLTALSDSLIKKSKSSFNLFTKMISKPSDLNHGGLKTHRKI